MISEDILRNWSAHAQWQTLAMIEQDLIISRTLICLYNDPVVKNSLVFRGGTALNKLFIKPPARYSEDIDFVQKRAEPIGLTINAIRECLKSWLGEPKRKITERSAKLIYTYQSIDGLPAKLKIEINTTEHFQVLPLQEEFFSMTSEWFEGSCTITTYSLEELMATKLRALYQRRKGRDLFDLWFICKEQLVNIQQVIAIFEKYCTKDGTPISRELFQKNITLKKAHPEFSIDMTQLLPLSIHWNFESAFEFVLDQIINKIP